MPIIITLILTTFSYMQRHNNCLLPLIWYSCLHAKSHIMNIFSTTVYSSYFNICGVIPSTPAALAHLCVSISFFTSFLHIQTPSTCFHTHASHYCFPSFSFIKVIYILLSLTSLPLTCTPTSPVILTFTSPTSLSLSLLAFLQNNLVLICVRKKVLLHSWILKTAVPFLALSQEYYCIKSTFLKCIKKIFINFFRISEMKIENAIDLSVHTAYLQSVVSG